MKTAKAFWCCLLQPSVLWLYLELSVSYCPQHCWGGREVLVKKKFNFHARWFFLVLTVVHTLSKGQGHTVSAAVVICFGECWKLPHSSLAILLPKTRKHSKKRGTFKDKLLKPKTPAFLLAQLWHLDSGIYPDVLLNWHFSQCCSQSSLAAGSKACCSPRSSTSSKPIASCTFCMQKSTVVEVLCCFPLPAISLLSHEMLGSADYFSCLSDTWVFAHGLPQTCR